MKLQDIAKQILNEAGSWGTSQDASAAGGVSPGTSPNAVSPAATPNVKFYNVAKDFQTFTTKVDAEEENARKELDGTLTKSLLNKEVVARASKGAAGQVEKDYTLTVKAVDITYLKDKYYIILKGSDKKDYYINTGFKVKILGAGKSDTPPATILEPPPEEQGKKNPSMGGVAQPQKMGVVGSKGVPGA